MAQNKIKLSQIVPIPYSALIGAPPAFSGSYNDLTNKPALFSGAYADLTGKPALFSGAYADLTGKPVLFSGAYADLTGKPTLATVATSGSYADLINKPTLFSGAYADLTGKPTLFSGSYTDLTNKPALNFLPLTGGTLTGTLTLPGFNSSADVYLTTAYSYLRGTGVKIQSTNGLFLQPDGGFTRVGSLAGTGTRMVVADDNGELSSQAIPSGGGSGGTSRAVATVTGATTAGNAANTDYVYFINGGTLTMPSATGNTNSYKIKNINSANTSITGTIDGGTLTLSQDEAVEVISDGTNWRIF